MKDYLTLHIHRSEARNERIWCRVKAGSCTLAGCYTNSPHFLLRYDVKDNSDKHLALVLSQYKKSNNLNYTLSCYSTEDIELTLPGTILKNHKEVASTWSTYTAGGPIGCSTYFTNPQYSIFIPYTNTNQNQSAEIQFCVSSTASTAINALLFPIKRLGDKVRSSSG